MYLLPITLVIPVYSAPSATMNISFVDSKGELAIDPV